MKKVLFILGELIDTDIEWIISNGKRERIPASKILIEEGGKIDALYIVLDGIFSVTVSALNNEEVARLGTGEMIGEMSYVDSRPPSATVTALENSLVLCVSRDALTQKLNQDTGFGARFYRALAIFLSDRLRGTVSRLGYGESETLEEDMEYEDELDLNVLDNVSMAGLRFERILRKLRGDE